jgi:hypothetical protein
VATLFYAPRFTPVDAQGDPYPGATLTFYAAGTTTPQPVYSTAALVTPLTNPVVANAAGSFEPIFLDQSASYRVILRDASNVTLFDIDNISSALTAEEIGRGLYTRTTGEISAGITPTAYRYAPADIRRYGATGNGTSDDVTAFNSALASNDYALVPDAPTAWRVNSTVSIPDNKGICGVGLGSLINKGANGAMFSMGRNSYIDDVFLDGKGATFTGVNVTIPFTAEFEGYQRISRCRIYDSASYCVQYVSSTAGAGFGSKIIDCDLRVRSDAVECVQWGNDPANSHGNRSLINCTAGSGALIDCNNADNGFVIGCTSGDGGGIASIKYGATSAKIIAVGNRFASTNLITIQGQAHTFVGNVVASGITLASGTLDCRISENVVTGTITDSSGQSNEIDMPLASYAMTWTGAGGNPAIGDGSVYSFYTREGRLITVTIGVTMGSTTTYGTGEWRFSLPITATGSTNCYGTFIAYDSSGTLYYSGVVQVAASGTYATLIPHGAAGAATSAVPFTWASGDFVRMQFTYLR